MICLSLTILQELMEKTQSLFQQAQPNKVEIAEKLYPLLKKGNSKLRLQVLYISSFLCSQRSLKECFHDATHLTKEDIETLKSSVDCQFTLSKTLRLIEHVMLERNNRSMLLENGILEFLESSLEEEGDSDSNHEVAILVEKLITVEPK